MTKRESEVKTRRFQISADGGNIKVSNNFESVKKVLKKVLGEDYEIYEVVSFKEKLSCLWDDLKSKSKEVYTIAYNEADKNYDVYYKPSGLFKKKVFLGASANYDDIKKFMNSNTEKQKGV